MHSNDTTVYQPRRRNKMTQIHISQVKDLEQCLKNIEQDVQGARIEMTDKIRIFGSTLEKIEKRLDDFNQRIKKLEDNKKDG